MDAAVAAGRVVLAIILGSSGVHKLHHRGDFGKVLVQLRTPIRAVRPLAFGIPLLECAIALGLALDETWRAAGLAAAGMLFSFTFVLAARASRDLENARCGCGGVVEMLGAPATAAMRSGAFALLALATVIAAESVPLLSLAHAPSLAGAASAYVGTTVLLLLAAAFEIRRLTQHRSAIDAERFSR